MRYILEVWTAGAPDAAGTADPLYISVVGLKSNGQRFNIARSKKLKLGLNDYDVWSIPVSEEVSVTTSAAIRLKGLAPNPVDNWLPKRIKLLLDKEDGSEPQVIVNHDPWPPDQWFDDGHRSRTIFPAQSAQKFLGP